MAEVAFRNLERAKEAIRTLEEACRASWPCAATRLERARYTLYAVEKGLGHITDRSHGRRRIEDARLCLLATSSLLPEAGGDMDPARRIEGVVEMAVGAGVDVVQLREKERSDREALRIGRALREITARAGALLVVNDRPDMAAILDADGVHLGQGDLPVAEARSIVGDDRLVGVSTHSLEQARAAERDGADYIGIGPVFPSITKDAGPLLGAAGLEKILEQVSLPAFAIGGIGPERIAEIRRAGGNRVAVSSAILRAVDVQSVVHAFRESLGAGQR
jgi:thiamine-phosphate pyrophosphorylase